MPRLLRTLTLFAATCLTLGASACDDDDATDVVDSVDDDDTSADTDVTPGDTIGGDPAGDATDDDIADTSGGDLSDTSNGDSNEDGADAVDADHAEMTDAGDVADADVDSPPSAGDYCETTAQMFCDFYLRCGRMAVDDVATCLEVFDESCNARYEPLYVALAEAGRLRLSAAGIAACSDHLATVACDQHIFDLDGPCAQVWEGQELAGGDCGPGIDYYVCSPGTTCVLDLSFCGTCTPAAPVGQPCGDGTTCEREARCIDGTCVARRRPGESCDDATAPCIVGARCVDSVCQGIEVVAIGESCGQVQRCPYKAACVGGVCVEQSLQGELCGAGGCATGTCDDTGRCVALSTEGESCGSGGQCVSQVCDDSLQTCAPIEAGFCGD